MAFFNNWPFFYLTLFYFHFYFSLRCFILLQTSLSILSFYNFLYLFILPYCRYVCNLKKLNSSIIDWLFLAQLTSLMLHVHINTHSLQIRPKILLSMACCALSPNRPAHCVLVYCLKVFSLLVDSLIIVELCYSN